MTKTDKSSLGALLLHGGDWHGIRVMGLGERLAVIGVSCVTSLLCLYAAGYFPSRREMSGDPGRRDGDDNRRDGGRENRVEALQEPSSGAPEEGLWRRGRGCFCTSSSCGDFNTAGIRPATASGQQQGE